MSRWVVLDAVSNSGKTLFVCRYCGTRSVSPNKECNALPSGIRFDDSRTCAEREDEYNDRLIHPIQRNALLRLSSLLERLLKLKTKKARLDLLRSDRGVVLSTVKHAIMKHGKKGDLIRIWDVNDDIENIRKELERK